MPGGFHPFHAGHMALYNSARQAFPDADLYVAATNSQEERPFPFAVKEKLAKVAGVAPGHFIQVKSPFQAKEITQNYNPDEDILIFVRSEKDRNESPKPGGTKKDGSPAYFQPYTGKNMQPFSKHAYFAYLPTVKFGPGITSATEIRKAWPTLDDRRKTAMVMSLYPAAQKNQKLATNIVGMLDQVMGEQQGVAEGAPIVVAQAPIDVRNPKKAPQPYRNQGDIVPPTKPPSTEKRGVKGRPGQRPMPKYDEGMAEAAKKCPPATQDITLNLNNRQKAIDEYGYGPLNPDMPNTKFWMLKVDEWNLDSMEEAQQSLCGNCAAFDIRQDTLDCIAQGIDSDSPEDAEGVIDAGELGYCKFLKFKCASRRTCDAWVTGGPLQDKPTDESVLEGSDEKDNLIWTLNSFGYYSDNSSVYVNDDGDKIVRVGSEWKHQSGKRGRGPEELGNFLSSNQGVAEGKQIWDGTDWGPQGRFAGDTHVDVGGAVMKMIQVGDIVKYFGQKAEIVALSKDRKRARIRIKQGMGGITQDVNTNDLKQLGQGVAEEIGGVGGGFGTNYPGTYEQENRPFTHKGGLKLTSLTTESVDYLDEK